MPPDRTPRTGGRRRTRTFRTGLPGQLAKYQVTFVGTVEDFRSGQPSDGPSENYRETSTSHWQEVQAREEAYPEAPVVFLIEEYYSGLCNGLAEGACSPRRAGRARSRSRGLRGDRPGDARVDGCRHLCASRRRRGAGAFRRRGSRCSVRGPSRAARRSAASGTCPRRAVRARVLPGLLAAPFFGLRDTVSRIARSRARRSCCPCSRGSPCWVCGADRSPTPRHGSSWEWRSARAPRSGTGARRSSGRSARSAASSTASSRSSPTLPTPP